MALEKESDRRQPSAGKLDAELAELTERPMP